MINVHAVLRRQNANRLRNREACQHVMIAGCVAGTPTRVGYRRRI